MNRRSRLTVIAGTLLFVGLSLWWMVWFPYRPEKVRGAIPFRATMVSEHHHLQADAQHLLANRSLQEAVHVLGGDTEAIDAFMESGLGRWLAACLGGRHTVTAFVPRSSAGAEPAWVAASWGGVRAQVTRWLIGVGLIKGWERVPDRSPIACYVMKTPLGQPVLSASVYEGVVLLAYSRDSGALRRMVRRLTYGPPASRLVADTVPPPDRVRASWTPQTDGAPCNEYTWDLSDTTRIAVAASWPTARPVPLLNPPLRRGGVPFLSAGIVFPPVELPEHVQLGERERERLASGLGSLSGALVMGPSAVLDALLTQGAAKTIGSLYRDTIRSRLDLTGVIAVGLLRDTYSGRLLGIKTPSLVLAARTATPLDLATELPPLLDRWNAQLGLSLLARERGGEGVFIIDEARNGIYSSMKASEKPALWQSGHWLFIASNLAAAREVMRAMEQSATPAQSEWWTAARAAPTQVHGWFDFMAAGSAIRKLMALHAIVQIAQGERSGPAVVLMERTGRAVSALEPFGEGTMQLRVGRDAWTVDARVGH